MTDTNPPELYWSNTLGLLKRKDDLWWVVTGGWESLRHYLATGADSNPESAHADRLVSQTEVDKANRRYEVAFEGREDAWNQLDTILATFGETTETVDISAVASFVQKQMEHVRAELAELAGLREHAIQLPEDWRERIGTVVAGGDSAYVLTAQLCREVESWRTATHPTPQGKVTPGKKPMGDFTMCLFSDCGWTFHGEGARSELEAHIERAHVEGRSGVLGVDQPNPPANWEPKVGGYVEWNDGQRWRPAKVTAVFRNDVQIVCGGHAVLTDRTFVRRPASETSSATNVGASEGTSNETGLIVGASETSEPRERRLYTLEEAAEAVGVDLNEPDEEEKS